MVMKKIGAMVLSFSLMGWLVFPQVVFSAEKDGKNKNVPAEEVKKSVYTVAVLPFEASGDELKNVAPEVSQLMTTYLSGKEGISLVERDKLDKAISEMGLGISGTVDPQTAAQIGKIVGAKILISGRVFAVQSELFLVAKIIGAETSQVLAESVSLLVKNSYADATQQLADKVVATITAQGEVLVAEKKTEHDTLEDLKLLTEGKQNLPTIAVTMTERHVGQPALDPAAETELNLSLSSLGFKLLDAAKTTEQPDIEITGEAFSEFGMRNGNLVSCKGRVEVKVLEHSTGKIIAVDRQTEVAVDLSEQIAGKAAIQKAAKEIAIRIVPKILDSLKDAKAFVSE